MKVLITGGNGFLGQKLAQQVLTKGLTLPDGSQADVDSMVLVDVQPPPDPNSRSTRSVKSSPQDDPRVITRIADIGDAAIADSLIGEKPDVIFHLAAVVSGQAEAQFDLGLRINLHGTLNLLEACRELSIRIPLFVFASSCGIYGGKNIPDVLTDATTPMPQISYGAEKYASEILVTEYSRRGFIDGRSLRLPTVVVRPGKANAAASSFVSAVIREPLNGLDYACPVDSDTAMWVCSPRTVVNNLCHATSVQAEKLEDTRSIPLPGFTVTVNEMLRALEQHTPGAIDHISWKPDQAVIDIVKTWPARFETERADSLGFQRDTDFAAIIQQYVEDELG